MIYYVHVQRADEAHKELNMTQTTSNVGDRSKVGCTLVHIGRAWRVIGVGVERDGNTFCHLASLYEFRQQKNGKCPIQINDWVDSAVLANAKNRKA